MSFAYTEEQGPEAKATRARLGDKRRVHIGEGVSVSVGTDGPTYCVVVESGTVLDMLDDEEDEGLRRRATTVRRFPNEAERGRYLASRGWATEGRRERPFGRPSHTRLSYSNYFGWTGSSFYLEARLVGGSANVALTQTTEGGPPRAHEIQVPESEWARFEAELSLLGFFEWGEYPLRATDHPRWDIEYESGTRSVSAGGMGLPPGRQGAFLQGLSGFETALERMIGRQLRPASGDPVERDLDLSGERPEPSALSRAVDERDAVEHLLLMAMRSWATHLEAGRGDPAALDEVPFEQALLPHVDRLTPARTQVRVKELMEDWPGPGSLDLQLTEPLTPVWIELKWAKSAEALHYSLWDAGKVATAQRSSQASAGYLLAGAPASVWAEPRRAPAELFDVSVWEGDALVTRHESSWRYWYRESQRTFPLRLPTPIITVPVGTVRCVGATGEEWLLRLARVEAPGDDRYAPGQALAGSPGRGTPGLGARERQVGERVAKRPDSDSAADAHLRAALAEAAQVMEADERRLVDQREKQFRDAIYEGLSERLPGRVRKERQLALEAFRGVGGFDLLVDRPSGDGVIWLGEVKWAYPTRSKIYEAVWDAAKLCLAIAEHGVERCWLITGAPNVQWQTAESRELFSGGTVEFEQLWNQRLDPPGPNYGKTVGEDCLVGGLGNRFTRAPRALTIEPVDEINLRPGTEDWSIRAVAISPSREWIEDFAPPPPFPQRITQRWLEQEVPRMDDEHFAEFEDWLQQRRQTSAYIERVRRLRKGA